MEDGLCLRPCCILWGTVSRNLHLSIELNRGLGGLEFGTLPSEVERYLGPPDEGDRSGMLTHTGLRWQYSSLGLGVFFHTGELLTETWRVGDPFRVILFTASGSKFSLWGKRIIGLGQRALMGILRANGCLQFRELEKSGYPQQMQPVVKILRFDDINLELHFFKELLRTCQWGVPLQQSPLSYSFPVKGL